MAFEAHHFAGNRRDSKRSWARRYRKEAREKARARIPGRITAVLIERSDTLAKIRNEFRLIRYLDSKNVVSRELFGYRKEREFLIAQALRQMVGDREIIVGQFGDFWLPSQLASAELAIAA